LSTLVQMVARLATAPWTRDLAAVSAVSRSPMAWVTVASVGAGVGKFALPVIAVTMDLARTMRVAT
jgi:hypothetical protein